MKEKKITASILVRMGSQRLPGKSLAKLGTKSTLKHLVDRIRSSILIDEIIICTSINPLDDQIEDFCRNEKLKCFRGSEEDVLKRMADNIKKNKIKTNVEFLGDNPFPDILLVDTIIGYFLKHKYDLVFNYETTSYPAGYEVCIYNSKALLKADKITKNKQFRSHCNFNIHHNKKYFRIKNLEASSYIKRFKNLHIELDTEEDLKVLNSIAKNFKENINFGLYDVINLCKEKPQIFKANKDVHRRWKKYRAK